MTSMMALITEWMHLFAKYTLNQLRSEKSQIEYIESQLILHSIDCTCYEEVCCRLIIIQNQLACVNFYIKRYPPDTMLVMIDVN